MYEAAIPTPEYVSSYLMFHSFNPLPLQIFMATMSLCSGAQSH